MAGRALGELVRKMGDRVVQQIVPILQVRWPCCCIVTDGMCTEISQFTPTSISSRSCISFSRLPDIVTTLLTIR